MNTPVPGSPVRAAKRQTHPIALYCVLAFAITWLGVSPLVAQGLGLVDFSLPPTWHAIGALGPVLAALIAVRAAADPRAKADFRASMRHWRIPAGWWTVAIVGPVLLLILAVVGAWLAGGNSVSGATLAGAVSRPSWWLNLGVASVLYGLGEEPGWRGFLLPQLMRRRSPLRATFLTAGIWAAWHAPFFSYRFDFEGLPTLVGFFIAMVAGALWLSFLYLSTDFSVPAVVAWHIVWNATNMVAAEVSALVVGILNGGMIVLGFGLLLVAGPGLRWRTRSATREHAGATPGRR